MNRSLAGTVAALILLAAAPPGPAFSTTVRGRVARLAASDNPAAAQALLDSLLEVDPSDLEVGFLAAVMRERRGRAAEARDLWLQLEAVAPRSALGLLALRNRIELERDAADLLAGEGAGEPPETPAPASHRVVLVPLENLGPAEPGAGFGLEWSDLLADALAGSPLEPFAMPSLLAIQGELAGQGPVRAPRDVERHPVNTLRGLEARLQALPDPAGERYLRAADGPAPADAIDEALSRFRSDQGLPQAAGVDLDTQRNLEDQLRRWLMTPPRALPPAALPALMRRTGASLALRGTYELSGTQVTARFGWIDRDGHEFLPVRTRVFDRIDEGREALAAARELARAAGVAASGVDPVRAGPDLMGAVTAARLLIDRGLLDLGRTRLEELGDALAAWPAAERLRDALSLAEGEATGRSAALLASWASRSEVRPDRELRRLAPLLGLAGAPIAAATSEPRPLRILGSTGVLHVHVEGP